MQQLQSFKAYCRNLYVTLWDEFTSNEIKIKFESCDISKRNFCNAQLCVVMGPGTRNICTVRFGLIVRFIFFY